MEQLIKKPIEDALNKLYAVEDFNFQLQKTRKEFQGDITLVVFPLLKFSKKSPEQTADEIGQYLLNNCESISDYNTIKGFLNLSILDDYWISEFFNAFKNDDFGIIKPESNSQTIVVEFCSPNTNKPLHLGHIIHK